MYILLVCCLVTVVIETAFLAVCGYRKKKEIIIIVCANVLTNLCMNLCLSYIGSWAVFVIALEAAVVAAEFFIYRAAGFGKDSRRLLFLTLMANMLSCGAGLLVFGF